MNRNQYNLYINNISDITNEDCLISFFSQFGKIENYTYFSKNFRRSTAGAIITYGLSVDVNKIIRENQRIKFNGSHLYLRRILPTTRPAYERILATNELLISLDSRSNDKQFNEINIRKYFSKYGSIVSCRVIIVYTTYLIDFVETNSVDSAIIDEPHFYNEKELILRKYVSSSRIENFHWTKILFDQDNKKIKISLSERIRRLKDMIEALQFGQKIELKLIKRSYEEKSLKCSDEIRELFIQLRNTFDQMKEDNEKIKKKNNSLKLIIEQHQRIGKYIKELYRTKIEKEQNRVDELRQAINALIF